jgi:hypothetical protein
MSCKKELCELYTEAKMVGAAYLAVAQAQGQIQEPYGTKLANIVARFIKHVMDAERRHEPCETLPAAENK